MLIGKDAEGSPAWSTEIGYAAPRGAGWAWRSACSRRLGWPGGTGAATGALAGTRLTIGSRPGWLTKTAGAAGRAVVAVTEVRRPACALASSPRNGCGLSFDARSLGAALREAMGTNRTRLPLPQRRLRRGYRTMAESVGGRLSPVPFRPT